jgi:hypothetical protein
MCLVADLVCRRLIWQKRNLPLAVMAAAQLDRDSAAEEGMSFPRDEAHFFELAGIHRRPTQLVTVTEMVIDAHTEAWHKNRMVFERAVRHSTCVHCCSCVIRPVCFVVRAAFAMCA